MESQKVFVKINEQATLFGELQIGSYFAFDRQGRSLFMKLSRSRARNILSGTNGAFLWNESVYKAHMGRNL